MSNQFFKAVALSTALLLCTTSLAAYAAEVSVGGVSASIGGGGVGGTLSGSGGGVSVGGGSGGATASATAGGGGGNIASGGAGARGSTLDFSIGSGGGPLASVDSKGNPANGGSQSSGAVNLGSLLDGLNLGDITSGGAGGGSGSGVGAGAGGGGVAPGVRAIAAGLSSADQAVLKLRCRNVLASPSGFSRDVVQFCRMIAKL